MRANGIQKGDRVAAYIPNIPETVTAYLGTSAAGAIWSSCSPDFGAAGVIDRFSQINPKILFIGDKYFYNGRTINIIERLKEIISKIPSILKVVIVSYPGTEIEKKNNLKVDNSSLLKAITTVIIADVTMSLDNVLGVAGAAKDHYILLIFGLALSIMLMATAANLISKWIKEYRWIAWIGILAILVVAIDLIYTDLKILI